MIKVNLVISGQLISTLQIMALFSARPRVCPIAYHFTSQILCKGRKKI